jgi:hypothetical protein
MLKIDLSDVDPKGPTVPHIALANGNIEAAVRRGNHQP